MTYAKLTLLLVFLNLTLYAQEPLGKVIGKVKDAKSGEPLANVTVSLKNFSNSSLTQDDGSFILENLLPGTYTVTASLVGYGKSEVSNVIVTPLKATFVKIDLEYWVQRLEEIVIKNGKITNTESAVTKEIKQSDNIVSGISAQQIYKTQDIYATEVLKRISSATIVSDRFLVVRGLFDRYNTVFFNNAAIASNEVDRKSFSFDIIPANQIDRILIYKTPSADLQADFAGGLVKVFTASMPAKNNVEVNYANGVRTGTTSSTFLAQDASSTDWLGYNNGSLAIPSGVPSFLSSSNPDINALSKSFLNDWKINHLQADNDQRFSVNFSNLFEGTKTQFGNVLGLVYNKNYLNQNIRTEDWNVNARIADFADTRSKETVRLGVMENMGFKFSKSKIEFKNFLNQFGTSTVLARENQFSGRPNERYYALDRQDRTVFSSQLSLEQNFEDETKLYQATLGYSFGNNNSPDTRRIKYSKQQFASDTTWQATISGDVDIVNGGSRIYQNLKENIFSFNHNYSQKINFLTEGTTLKVGNYFERRSRTFNARVFGYVLKSFNLETQQLRKLGLDSIFDPKNVGIPNGFKISEITRPNDAYEAQNTQLATYAILNVPVTQHLNISGGLRHEYNNQSFQTTTTDGVLNPSIETNYILPSIHLNYTLNDHLLFRLAYGMTINRPEIREIVPFNYYDINNRADEVGSTSKNTIYPNGDTLKVAEIHNFDARFEYYPKQDEFFHFGVFYKKFNNPIQKLIVPIASDQRLITYINGESANVMGVELDVRKNLFYLNDGSKFSLVGNASLVSSETKINNATINEKTIPLQSQSPYTLNLGVYYQTPDAGSQLVFLLNSYGTRLYLLGSGDYAPIYELGKTTFDISYTQRIYKNFFFTASCQDIFNQSYLFKQDTNFDNKVTRESASTSPDRNYQEYKDGSVYNIGFKWRLR